MFHEPSSCYKQDGSMSLHLSKNQKDSLVWSFSSSYRLSRTLSWVVFFLLAAGVRSSSGAAAYQGTSDQKLESQRDYATKPRVARKLATLGYGGGGSDNPKGV